MWLIDKGVKKLLYFARRTNHRVPEVLGDAKKAVARPIRKKDGVFQKTLPCLVEKVTEESRVPRRAITQTVNRIKSVLQRTSGSTALTSRISPALPRTRRVRGMNTG